MARRKEPRIAECIAGLLFFGICLLKEYWQIVCLVIGGIIVLIIVINMCVNLNRKKQRPYNYPIYDNEIPSNYQEPLKEIDRTSNERPEKVKNHSNTHSKKSQKTPENNSYKSIEQRETYNQRKKYIGKVDIQNCTSEELLSLKDFPKEKIE